MVGGCFQVLHRVVIFLQTGSHLDTCFQHSNLWHSDNAELRGKLSTEALKFAGVRPGQVFDERDGVRILVGRDRLLDVILQGARRRLVRLCVDKGCRRLRAAGPEVIDPACGSGYFPAGGSRRLAVRITQLKSEGAPSPAEFRHGLREAARRYLFGIDRNPMAVELAKVAIETVGPGKPLTFLDAQIRCGDSLLGVYDRAACRRAFRTRPMCR